MTRPAAHAVDVLVAGAGRAGLAVVETLVAGGFDGSVAIVGAEPGLPYERPQVSKALLAGTLDLDRCELAGAAALAGTPTTLVTHMPSRVVAALDPATRTARLDDGSHLVVRQVVLATGTRPRPLPGLAAGPNVHSLRTAEDAERLRGAAARASTIVIVGAGFIGMEAASSLRATGTRVIVVDPAPRPMAIVLAPHLGDLLALRARADGIDLRCGATIDEIDQDVDGVLRSLRLSDGERLHAPEVLVAIGSIPSSPLGDHPNGIPTDAHGRTRMPSIFGCGDLAAWHWRDIGMHARVEHWSTSTGQGRAVGTAILGGSETAGDGYDAPPIFWSDQFGVRIQSIGHARGAGAWVPHEESPSDAASFVCSHTGSVRAVAALDRPELIAAWRRANAVRISHAA